MLYERICSVVQKSSLPYVTLKSEAVKYRQIAGHIRSSGFHNRSIINDIQGRISAHVRAFLRTTWPSCGSVPGSRVEPLSGSPSVSVSRATCALL